MEEKQNSGCCCCSIERVVGDIIVAMIRNGDMDQSDSTFEKRLKHTRDAVAGIFKELSRAHTDGTPEVE